ncbi:hypothetical protein RhiirC2_797400 [Rhizophagus irregularis]|uniref:Uncharacterized protein n=1 Tax=Rhizophagus irregularis TaxID=588596 RepID=A0A2N1M851_9GLOM|nr:hypothetical protein RhiirC2_797400 [Rhizophagus irregularis]
MKNKKNLSQTAAAIRQHKRRAAELLDEHKTRLTNDRKNKRIKRSLETSNQHPGDVSEELKDLTKIEESNIDDTAINKFNTPGYIARAFPTLYPTGWKVCSSSLMVILWFKFSDALACLTGRKIYVKQSLNGSQLMVGDIQEMMKDDNHMVDCVMHFGEGLRGTRQFWQKCSSELYDMIKQLGQKG